ncbi:winged helix-turn-helix domain-containing protein [Natrinema halophilum]|uniref:Winged helix-turn-helix transcriptional regulator n=1 Tax=Natrinema halophilum TaxID=1699371 RepID=A0A7D5GLY8_9EURY|nr:winged helix-turn-helix domain-containing protein [Natrinema halophilum]QLG49692.1 winged helix-turn-helix domain-containing protein [Natrinema halophilum]
MSKTESDRSNGGGKIIYDVLGDHPRTRIVFTLIAQSRRGDTHDLNISDLARMAGVERSTVYDHIDQLLETGVVEESRTIGNSKMYQINRDSEAAKGLAKFDDARLMEE